MSRLAESRSWLSLLASIVVLSWGIGPAHCVLAEELPRARQLYLEQGWTAEERQRFYYTTQGSQLIPYDWFLALEAVAG
ncbi:MAG: hypothetical protein L0Z50_11900, partial [Verrucomicrobiales bacterium]|nr:hypothetical protein [Verrucomicrobiales bacterium]